MRKRGAALKGQVSIEFLIIIGFAFLMTIPLVMLFFQQSQRMDQEITASQADKVASEIRDAADEVYYLGEPSKKTITIYMPEDVQSVTVANSKLIFVIDSPSGDYELVKWSAANLTGTINEHKGLHTITLEASSDNVLIADS